MSFQPTPTSIEILKIVSDESQRISDVFEKQSESFEQLQSMAMSSENVMTSKSFQNSSTLVTYMQLLFLLGISMHGGIFVPQLKTVRYDKNRFSMTWFSGINDAFIFGDFNEDFENFLSSFQSKCLSKRKDLKSFSGSIFMSIERLLAVYIDSLNQTDTLISNLLSDQHKFSNTNSVLSEESLFVFISCLPPDQINALFLFIQGFLPDDFSIKLGPTTVVKVCQFFESPTVDMAQLVEKVKLYFELYFHQNAPIIKDITQQKTAEFMTSLFNNEDVFRVMKNNLNQIRDNQIKTRLNIYKLYQKHIGLLLNS